MGKDRWPSTTATVYSWEFTTRQERDIPVCYYHVVISYTVAGEIYNARFVDFPCGGYLLVERGCASDLAQELERRNLEQPLSQHRVEFRLPG